ncbi:unnamed protein product [Pedinophyceae sp. YPF-701]|nr:unnamed protein product [Pedinophyceae sp. YPF-701]
MKAVGAIGRAPCAVAVRSCASRPACARPRAAGSWKQLHVEAPPSSGAVGRGGCGARATNAGADEASAGLKSKARVSPLGLLAPLSGMLLAAPAIADVVDDGVPPPDPLVTFLFVIAVAALVVVTGGVVYLSFTSWQDQRKEDADRAAYEQGERMRQYNESVRGPPRRKSKKRDDDGPSRGGGSGFGY